MKRIFTLLLLVLISATSGIAQGHINYNRDSKWFIGFNVGGTWTSQTEIKYRVLPGWGFTLGRSFGMLPKSPFCFDIRGRFLAADFAGQATTQYTLDSSFTGLGIYGNNLEPYYDSLGYFVPNYKTELVSGSLELVLNTNRLRNKTGWNLYAFGGIGIKGYRVAANLYDGDSLAGGIYDYSTFGGLSKSNILSKQDKVYETDLVGAENDMAVDWMPSLGVGFSYQLAPWCAFGLEHKVTWARTDNFDGMPNTFAGVPSGKNDLYHYSAASLKFHLFGDEQIQDPDPDVVDNTTPIVPVTDAPCQSPVIDIFDPSSSPYTQKSQFFRVQASVFYVAGKQNITFKQNGVVSSNFYYDANTDQFSCDVVISPGQNIFEITAQNECGQDYESTILVYQQDVVVKRPPIVTITNPSYSPYPTENSVFPLSATVLEVESKSQINVYFNGVLLTTFSYSLDSKILSASLNLMEGLNTVTITASNDVGSDSKTAQINYTKPQTKQPPVVDFTSPAVDPFLSVVPTYNVKAIALNVESKAFITARVNGFATDDFSFNPVSKEVSMNISLNPGANIIELQGVNEVGSDNDVTTIIYQKPEVPKPPVVTMIDPNIDPTTVYSTTYNVVAKVENVTGAANIQLKINGVNSELFSYSPSSQLMTFTVNLVEGANVILITANNTVGSDIGTTTIIRIVEAPKAPPIVYITEPYVDNKVFMDPDMTLYAKVLNVENSTGISVLFNGVPTSDFTFVSATKDLTLPLTLNTGSNTVTITGTNSAGSDVATRIIIHERPKDPKPPVVDITNPPSTPYLSEIPTFAFTANTTNIDSKDQISVLFNGSVVPSPSYAFTATGQILYNAELNSGSNVFMVTVTNLDGSANDMAIVNLKEDNAPCIIPTVGYISPVPYSTVNDASQKIEAQINNWSAGTTVELVLNGVSTGYMTYNATTSMAAKTIELTEGSNAVKVIVTNNCGTNFATFTLNYKKPSAPCSEPVVSAISPISSETFEAITALTAGVMNVTNTDQIKVTVNGTNAPFTFDAGAGIVSMTANLILGNNTIVVTAKTDCGTSLCTFNVLRKECLKPVILSVSPSTGTVLEMESAGITATVKNVISSEITLLVNGISQPFSYNETTDLLTATVALETGENIISLNAENSCGREKSELTITRKKPCAEIIVNLISPATPSVVSTTESLEITLNATGLSASSQIKVMVNGTDKSFTFDGVTGNIVVPDVALNDGANSVNITLTSECSNKTINYSVEYKGCKPPVITVDGMTDGMTFSAAGALFKASVTNISGPSDILVKHNGTVVDFNYDPSTQLVTATLTLAEGSNTIWIEARGCETVNKTTNVKYVVPCPDITTALMVPSTTELTVVEPSFDIKLTTSGVENSSEVVVTLNGSVVPFTFSPVSKVVDASGLMLVDGVNTVVITAQNVCSKAVVTYKITYNGCKPPVISFGANPTSVSVSDYHFTAFVSNISNSADLEFLVNGVPTGFIFNPATGAFNAEVKLNEGITYFTLTANGCEKKFETAQTNYEIPCEAIKYALNVPNTLTTAVADDNYEISLVAQYVTADDISVNYNGTVSSFTYAGDILTIALPGLKDGMNTVVVSLKNKCSAETITYSIKHDKCNAPVIDFSSTSTHSVVANIVFNAVVTNITSASKIVLKLNGTSVPITYDVASGALSANLTLVEGNNTVHVTANGCMLSEDHIVLLYEVPCVPLSYTLISPSAINSSDEDGKLSVSINCTEVESASDISVTVNGTSKLFTYSSGTISVADISLATGINSISVKMKNDCSAELVDYSIEYNPCNPPAVSLNNTVTKVNESSFDLSVTVLNISNKADIQLSLNGNPTAFEFDPGSHKLTSTLSLNKGENNVTVVANGCAKSSADYVVTYEVPCSPISYSLSVPSTTSAESSVPEFTINLGVTNVIKEQISVQHNGSPLAFTLMAGKVICTAALIEGSNEITVKMANDCSSETVTYSVIYTVPAAPCDAIKYNYILPNGNSAAVAEATYYFKLKTWYVESSADISVKLNGSVLQFTFDSPSGMLESKDMPLVEGTNTIVVTLKNACSSETLTFTVDYTKPVQGGGATGGLNDCPVDANGKVTICHFPPGNPDKPETITIAKAALNTHLDHHDDYCGPCEEVKDSSTTSNNTMGNPCEPITYSLIKPTKLSTVVHTQVTEIMVSAKHVVSTGIIAAINGSNFTNFSVDATSGLITFKDIPLVSGDNTFKVTLRNDCSNEVLMFDVKSVKMSDGGVNTTNVKPPVLTNVAPATSSIEVTSASYAFKVKVAEINGQSDIKFLFNGVVYNGFIYTATTGQVDAILNLKEGVNTVQVTATNSVKSVQASYSITYKKPADNVVVLAPVIKMVNPAGATATVTSAAYTLKATVTNITSKADITVFSGTRQITTFTYSTADKSLTVPLTLSSGANAIKITATSSGKSASATCTITYNATSTGGIQTGGGVQASPAPVIDFVSPLKPTVVSTTPTYTIKVKMTNVKTKEEVKLFVNDAANTAFTLDASGNFTTTVTLKSGANKVKIQATSGGQSVEKIFNITYTPTTQGVKTGGVESGGEQKQGGTTGGVKVGGGGGI